MANDGEVYGSKAANSDEVQSAFPPIDRHAYPNNMTVIARITQGGQPVSGAEIGVFADDECRGTSVEIDGLYFITISGEGNGPQLDVRVAHNGQVRSTNAALTYVDNAADDSDSIDITLDAQDSEWLHGWLPQEGATLRPRIIGRDWNGPGDTHVMECGLFILDDVAYQDAPTTLQVGGVSKPSDTDFSELERETIWKNTSIKRIGESIAGRYGLDFEFDGDDHDIDAKEQDATDSSFLQDLCDTYALVIKVYAAKLWVYDREKYKAKDAVWTVYEAAPPGNPTALCVERGSFKWSTKLTGTYTGGVYTYTNKTKKININVKVGTEERQLKLSGKVSSEADAKARLIAKLKNANHGATTISFTIPGYPVGASAQCINVVGFGKMAGKYFIDEMEHSYSPSGGYKTQVKASKVEQEEFA